MNQEPGTKPAAKTKNKKPGTRSQEPGTLSQERRTKNQHPRTQRQATGNEEPGTRSHWMKACPPYGHSNKKQRSEAMQTCDENDSKIRPKRTRAHLKPREGASPPASYFHFETGGIDQVSTLQGKDFPLHSRPAT